MKAVRIHSYGPPQIAQLDEVPLPTPAPGELLIRVKAAGVNPFDWKVCEGQYKSVFNLSLPVILGGDVSGVIEKVGEGVAEFRVGEPVCAMIGLFGAYADYAVVKAELVAPKPPTLEDFAAAAMPIAALTAWQMLLEQGRVAAGQRVLIHAAAGGVGSCAVQIARSRGAYVIGVASDKNADYVRDLGADEVIDRHKHAFEDAVRDIDLVIDLMGGDTLTRSWRVIKPGGLLVSAVSEPSQVDADAARARGIRFRVRPDGAQLREIALLAGRGDLRTEIEAVFPLARAVDALERSKMGRTRGKLVLTVSDGDAARN